MMRCLKLTNIFDSDWIIKLSQMKKELSNMSYIIYLITNLQTNKPYVGITGTEITTRIKRHVDDALIRNRGKAESLHESIREAYINGKTFKECFKVEIINSGLSQSVAGQEENRLIEYNNSMAPNGYNILKGGGGGGGSFGSTANAKAIKLAHPKTHESLEFSSVKEAVDFRNKELKNEGLALLKYATVTSRLRKNLSTEEALEYVTLTDKRKLRDEFLCNGVKVNSIAEIATELGLNHQTVRSRIYRNADNEMYDVAKPGMDKREVIPYSQPVLPDPDDSTKPLLSCSEFARRVGLPDSTIRHRFKRLASVANISSLTAEKIYEMVTTRRERRKIIALILDDGRVLEGGVRELIKLVLETPNLRVLQKEKLTGNGIRARLWRTQYSDIEWAFGFRPKENKNRKECRLISRDEMRNNQKGGRRKPFFSPDMI